MAAFATLAEKITALVAAAIRERVFSGCAVAIGQDQQRLVRYFGTRSWQDGPAVNKQTFFDLASLSKPLATGLAALSLIGRGTITLETCLPELLGCEVGSDKKGITLLHLLNHCSGLPGHRPFYTELAAVAADRRRSELLQRVLAEPLAAPPGSQAIYSDLGFILLGYIIEEQSGISLEEAVAHLVLAPLRLEDRLVYNPRTKGIDNFAAGQHCPWRQRLIVGEVDDQNTWVMGGVSGQAGLFGRAEDVLTMVRMITEIAAGIKTHPFLTSDLVHKAMRRQGPVRASSWGLAFDTPSESGSSAGRFISPASCGHLGFTGTSFWHDFERDISVVLLTNRIHPSVDNDRIKTFRPQFHDLVFQSLAG